MAASLGNFDEWLKSDKLRVNEHTEKLQQTAKNTILSLDRIIRPLLSTAGNLLGTNGNFIVTASLCEICQPFLKSQYESYHELSLEADRTHSARDMRFVPVAFWYLSFFDKRIVTITLHWDIVLNQSNGLFVSYRNPKSAKKFIPKKTKATCRSLVCTLEKMFPELRGYLKALYKSKK